MRARLVFDLSKPGEADELHKALHANDYLRALYEIQDLIRELQAHDHSSSEAFDLVAKIERVIESTGLDDLP